MKIRSGFVSNSSSASFLCEICGDCWDSDHAPMIVGGLCSGCTEEHEICNCCGKVFHKSQLFLTLELVQQRGGYTDEKYDEDDWQAKDNNPSYTDWPSKMTCPDCLVEKPDLIAAWVQNSQHAEWVKTVSNPDHKMTALDEKLTEALIKHDC